MKKYSKKQMVIGMIVVLALVAGAAYLVVSTNQPKSTNECGSHNGKEYCTGDYIGLTEEEAGELADSDGLNPKLRQVDDDTNPNNTDSGGTPIFFTVKDGIITKAELH